MRISAKLRATILVSEIGDTHRRELQLELIQINFSLLPTGLAIDGFSGGGGAVKKIMKKFLIKTMNSAAFKSYLAHIANILLRETIIYFQANNGQFFGQFVGKFISSLSAVKL